MSHDFEPRDQPDRGTWSRCFGCHVILEVYLMDAVKVDLHDEVNFDRMLHARSFHP